MAEHPSEDADPTEQSAAGDATPVGEVLPIDSTPVDGDSVEAQEAGALSRSRRPMVLAGIGALLIVGVSFGLLTDRSSAPAPKPDIPLEAWAPYWTLDASNPVAAQRLPSMREISPFWFNATGTDTIEIDPNANVEATDEFLDIARSSGTPIVPSIVDAMPAGGMAAVLANPKTRTRHVDAIIEFADEGDFDGIDLDYEQFAFADGRDTWAETRPNWVAFIEELSKRLRADSRTLTVSIPSVYDDGQTDASGFWVYDHGAIVDDVDRIRIMAYDFSVGEPGPIAPLEFVQRAIDGAVAVTQQPNKIVLGLPAYGRNWPIGTTGECEGLELEGRTAVNARTVDDLVERRDATPVFDEVTGEWSFGYDLEIEGSSCVQQRQVNYVDADGVRLRMDLARENQLGGVALWAFGFDDADVWDEILPTVQDT